MRIRLRVDRAEFWRAEEVADCEFVEVWGCNVFTVVIGNHESMFDELVKWACETFGITTKSERKRNYLVVIKGRRYYCV